MEVINCIKIDEYMKCKEKELGQHAPSKPGKIPVRLNKPESKVPTVYYFVILFLTKWAGEIVNNIVDVVLYRERMSAVSCEPIKARYSEVSKENADLKEKVASSDLINGLMITDMEKRIRDLEVDVTVKERIILEKNEGVNILWEKN
ncbi:hypothetical protein RhiirA4_506567 [Rhizophagus irregularis]|uniref:Uncharacterized protein n=1 Tax=Rhizophagus irregularis TaxID=588596 RepID=A0A2I1HB99_9GLOM|nr:hypothetical protein RhiirA4_506567 [Rhizophagus irregularis]